MSAKCPHRRKIERTVDWDNEGDSAMRNPFLDFADIGDQDCVVYDAAKYFARRHCEW
jgi:hypothetical protein